MKDGCFDDYKITEVTKELKHKSLLLFSCFDDTQISGTRKSSGNKVKSQFHVSSVNQGSSRPPAHIKVTVLEVAAQHVVYRES